MIEKLHLHKMAVTLRMMGRQPIVFIKVERHNVSEGETLLPVQSDQLPVKLDRSRAGRQPENGRSAFVLATANQTGNRSRHNLDCAVGTLKDGGWNPFVLLGFGGEVHPLISCQVSVVSVRGVCLKQTCSRPIALCFNGSQG